MSRAKQRRHFNQQRKMENNEGSHRASQDICCDCLCPCYLRFIAMIHLFQVIGFTVFWLINARLAFHLESVKHVVMFSFRRDVTRSEMRQVEQALLDLPKAIPQIQDCELGRDFQLIAGQIHPAGKNRALYWSASFSCVSDYKRYDRHPAHVAILETMKPLILPGSRAAIQYRIKK